MPEGPEDRYEREDRRTGKGRRSGEERRKDKRGIRGLFPFSLLLDRRSGKDRRSGGDRREQGAGVAGGGGVRATELAMDPNILEDLAAKSGVPLKRLEKAAAGRVELSAEEQAALRKR